MSQHARVETLEALKQVRTALNKFAGTVSVGLDESEAEVRQAGVWLEQEQVPYWKREVVRQRELVNRLKVELTRKEYTKKLLDSAMSVVEDRKALNKARARLEVAEEKMANCKRWTRILEHETFSFKGGIQGLGIALQQDVPRALALLDNMIKAIEAYADVRMTDDVAGPMPSETSENEQESP